MPEDYQCFDTPARTYRHPRDRENDRLRAALNKITKTPLDAWEFRDSKVVATVHLIAHEALEQGVMSK